MAGLVLCLYCLSRGSGHGETNAAYKAALAGLKVCTSLITAQDMEGFGFHSTNEFDLAQLAEPFPVYDFSLAMLRKWQPTQDLSRVFAQADTMLFPVTVNQDVRVSIAVTKGTWGWKPAEFGGRPLARLFSLEREKSTKAVRLPVSAYFCARAPALNAYFVGYPATNGFMLISVANHPELKLDAGVPVPATNALKRLARAARRHGSVLE